jgi:hypothetical protein
MGVASAEGLKPRITRKNKPVILFQKISKIPRALAKPEVTVMI